MENESKEEEKVVGPEEEEEKEEETTTSLPNENRALKVLFLSADTGGGHRASAESLAKQFEILYPGTTYDLLDILTHDGVPPYSNPVPAYKHLSAHPKQWKLIYGLSNTRAFELIADTHLKLTMEKAVRRRIKSYNPDVVVSVHPMMTNVPVVSCSKISEESGRHLPIFTVVTDLGSAHCLWFANGVEKMFIASEQIRALAKSRGKVPDEKLVERGLPIRHDFALQARNLGLRTSDHGRQYQRQVRADLNLPSLDLRTVLIMGGGEGVGSLSNIVDALYIELTTRGIDALLLVVCGRNETLKSDLENRHWAAVIDAHRLARDSGARSNFVFKDACAGVAPSLMGGAGGSGGSGGAAGGGTASGATGVGVISTPTVGCIQGGVTQKIRNILSSQGMENAIAVPGFDNSPALLPQDDQPKLQDKTMDEDGQTIQSPAGDPFPTQQTTAAATDADAPPPNQDSNTDTDTDLQYSDAVFSEEAETPGKVTVMPLGFVNQMAEYMVAADILVSKAGPGTIAEAASLSLPVVLTSFLPGQEEGNLDFVVDGGFGAFRSDDDPFSAAEEVASWLLDDKYYAELSANAGAKGAPNAAAEIVKEIGDSTLRWRQINAMNSVVLQEKAKQQTHNNSSNHKLSALDSLFTTGSSHNSNSNNKNHDSDTLMPAMTGWFRSRSTNSLSAIVSAEEKEEQEEQQHVNNVDDISSPPPQDSSPSLVRRWFSSPKFSLTSNHDDDNAATTTTTTTTTPSEVPVT